MSFPPTLQDELPSSAGYALFVNGPNEGTQGVSYPAGYPSTGHYEPIETVYDDTYTVDPQVLVSDSSMVLAAPAHTAAGDVGAGQPMSSSSYASSNNAQNLSKNGPIMTAVPPASNIAPQVPSTQVTTQHRFRCPMCLDTFDRFTRAEACQNHHLGRKPHMCEGACGNMACNAAYGSIENLDRHILPPTERKVACPHCARSILKQNISRHKKSCL